MRSRVWLPLLLVPVLAGSACPRRQFPPPYPQPTASELLAHIESIQERAPTLRAETVSDVWLGKERAKVTVLILAAWGGKLRFQALNPSGATAADLASDGTRYCDLDATHDCGECGPATPANVARLIHIPLEPNDVVATLMGTTPLLADAKASLRWDATEGHEILDLVRPPYSQRIVLDGADRRWDVLDSEMKKDGQMVWRIRHKGFHVVTTASGEQVRMPAKSMFERPGENVLIVWKEQEVGIPIADSKFRIELPPGLPICGQPQSGG